jgi:hypothetical protein
LLGGDGNFDGGGLEGFEMGAVGKERVCVPRLGILRMKKVDIHG